MGRQGLSFKCLAGTQSRHPEQAPRAGAGRRSSAALHSGAHLGESLVVSHISQHAKVKEGEGLAVVRDPLQQARQPEGHVVRQMSMLCSAGAEDQRDTEACQLCPCHLSDRRHTLEQPACPAAHPPTSFASSKLPYMVLPNVAYAPSPSIWPTGLLGGGCKQGGQGPGRVGQAGWKASR